MSNTFAATQGTDSNWSFIPEATWQEGVDQPVAIVEDKAGNAHHSATLQVTIDSQITMPVVALAPGHEESDVLTGQPQSTLVFRDVDAGSHL